MCMQVYVYGGVYMCTCVFVALRRTMGVTPQFLRCCPLFIFSDRVSHYPGIFQVGEQAPEICLSLPPQLCEDKLVSPWLPFKADFGNQT